MRILIVGGGIAGLTLAALLRRRGVDPVVIEKAQAYDPVGYSLGLWPLGVRVLHGLGLYERYCQTSVAMSRYNVRDDRDRPLKSYSLDEALGAFGGMRGMTRFELIDLLRRGLRGLPIRMGTTVDEIRQSDAEAQVTFCDGSQDRFDLVVGADGIHSQLRRLVFGDLPLWRTGWGGWGWWIAADGLRTDVYTEYWGRGRFFGFYPAKGRVCCFAVAPTAPDGGNRPPGGESPFPPSVNQRFETMGRHVPAVRSALDQARDVYFTEFADVWLPNWSRGRVVLIGDASAAFLPTAGLGASMAMESASVLSDELSRVNAGSIPPAIGLFQRRRRCRVRRLQKESRRLARLMFVKSAPMALIRNGLIRCYPQRSLFRSVRRNMEQPI